MSTGSNEEPLHFLFDKRLQLFNVRRDHEWKIFGVMTLIGAVDVALITEAVNLTPTVLGYWRLILGILFVATVTYQFGVQTRNRVDRLAMDELHELLCNAAQIPVDSLIRIPIDRATEKHLGRKNESIFSYTYLWAFTWQTLVLFVLCVVSWFIPVIA